MPKQPPRRHRGRPFVLLIGTLVMLLLASSPSTLPALTQWEHNNRINSQGYKEQYGHWQTLDIPEEFRLNAMHAALLPTGKVLLVAGSGNNRQNFNSYYNDGQIAVLKTAILDPETGQIKLIETPSDLFCSGHALLHSGSLLVAGGTSGYELLDGITKPAGPMVLHNEDPDSPVKVFKKGTRFVSPSGKVYVSLQDATLQPAHKMDHGNGNAIVHHSSAKVFVEAVADDASYVTDKIEQYSVEGLEGSDVQNIYGMGGSMTLTKQDFRGDNKAYEFDPVKEAYVQVEDMKESRWYPSLPVLTDGSVLAVSGLDNAGIITETTEYYDPEAKTWSWGPNRAIPTYPALFRTEDPDVLFFSGSSAGYGPADKGRNPGFWNVKTNTFHSVPGLRQPELLETSASVYLPPAKGSNDGSQSSRVMVAGGGGIGESNQSTNRTDVIDLKAKTPRYVPGPDLPDPVRYLNVTVTPWDDLFATGGTRDYRAKGNSYSYKSFSINPANNSVTRLADAPVGRGYHSGSLLLPSGKILVFGGDPLFADKDGTTAGTFEQRIEIYTPPQFFRGSAPQVTAPEVTQIKRGQELTFQTGQPGSIKTARLIPPSSTTHVTNIEQRSVGVIVSGAEGGVKVDIPKDENLLPNGWYMLFLVNDQGMPAKAKMVQIVP